MNPLISKNIGDATIYHLLVAIFTITLARCCVAQETTGWAGARVKQTDLHLGQTKHGKFAYSFAAVMTSNGCHVAKAEGERGKAVFVRRDGQPGRDYEDISHPVFSPDGSALAYAVRGVGGAFFVINEQESPKFSEVMPDTFVFSNDGKRHAYLARKNGKRVAVVDGLLQAEADGDMVPWLQPPMFSADGSSVGYVEDSSLRKKMRAVVNGKAGEFFDGVATRSLQFSANGRRMAYAANDRSAGNRWFWVINDQRGKDFDAVGVSFAFSPDGKQFAYTGRRAQERFLVVNDKPEVTIEGIVDYCLTFSPDSRRLAYAVAKPDRRSYLVVDGKAGPVHDGIGVASSPGLDLNRASMQTGYRLEFATSILFSPDSRRIAYLAHFGKMKKVFLDDKPEDVEMDFLAGGMVFSDDSKRLAYGGRRGNQFFLVVDGKKSAAYDALGYFGFSADGNHIALTAKKGDKIVVVVDGLERAEYDAVPAGAIFRSDGVLEFLAADKTSLYRIEVSDF